MTPLIRFPKPLRPAYGLSKVTDPKGNVVWRVLYYLNERKKTVQLSADTFAEACARRDSIYARLADEHGITAPHLGDVRERGIHYRKPWVVREGKTRIGEFDTLDEAKQALAAYHSNTLTV